ncbi:Eukaryotic aspartyl protease family protein [Striga hermonthica]|uniref:Eukaryotic aspartyl protease family protein n=1 Tax=Striga hermonthica TaxID=68872 RepID=A0A9N7NWQ4_STRHE|nr:Eukaryotic aspartyl protease family protein [Striga hermonthica]
MNILIIAVFISLLILTPFTECGGQNSNTSPTVTLIRRDSSLSSTHQLSAQTPLPNPTISNSGGDYLVNYSIGSFSTSGMPDTGSDLIWAPCSSPASFSTPVPCTPTICDDLTKCNPVGNKCNFTMQYFDGTIATGDLFADTITFDRTSVSNITFGCDYTGYTSGMVGLGRGELSLVNQTAVTKWATQEAQLMPVQPPSNWNIDLCFNTTDKDLSASFPGVTVYMGGKSVTLGYNNVLVNVGSSDDGGRMFLCMAVIPSTNGIPQYGNLAQTDFLVGIDLKQNTISFKNTTCGS